MENLLNTKKTKNIYETKKEGGGDLENKDKTLEPKHKTPDNHTPYSEFAIFPKTGQKLSLSYFVSIFGYICSNWISFDRFAM